MDAVKVTLLPTRVWVESGMFGERAVVMQHDGFQPFDYAVFNYDYAYTSNSGTLNAAENLALQLGATAPVEHRPRNPRMPSATELREHIAELTLELERMEAESASAPPSPPPPAGTSL